MNVEMRGREAAEGLRLATKVDVEAGLSDLRRTRRRRDAARLVAACSIIAAIIGGGFLVMDRGVPAPPPPAKDPGLRNGLIIHAGDREFGKTPSLPNEPQYPLWQGADPASGSFLYAESRVAIVKKSGTVAEVECPIQPCEFGPYPGDVAFGPGEDEVTFTIPNEYGKPPQSLQIVGYDGDIREEIDLPGAALPDRSFGLVTWSPDGRELAVAMDDTPEVWIIARDGSRARLVHREEAPQKLVDGRYDNPPVVVDLAWSPDGSRLGILVANRHQGNEGEPGSPSKPLPRLIAVPAEGGDAQTLHTFDFRNPNSTVPGNFIREWAFAWSPDGKRIAVTSDGGIAEISTTDGTVLTQHPGYGVSGPITWLPK